ncbi:ABC transporter permease [Terriglobus sp.]|uniref:ABC transporter permease n=1 Tax=Terriglobus sp. TaxID=1889013 RepID=UPI003AFFA2D9
MRFSPKLPPVLRQVLLALPVLWLIVTLVFMLIHLVPGDPVAQMLGEGASSTDLSALRHAYGLDASLPVQYGRYLRGLLHADLGTSLRTHDPVLRLIVQRFPYTLLLSVCALALALLLSIPGGVAAALYRGGRVDRAIGVVSLFGLSFPNFALGPILILLFSIRLGWLPVSGAGAGPLFGMDTLLHLILPALTLGLSLAAILTRMVRTSMLEELGQDYIRTARAKGLPEREVLYHHALRNALVPVLTVVGLQFGSLLAGAIVTETIFSWPGLGRLTITSISNRDYAVVQGCTLVIGLTYLLANLLTDVAYRWANPRMRS